MQALTSRERVERAFDHRDHDRVPRFESFWDDTLRRWEGEGLAGGFEGALQVLGADMHVCSWTMVAPFPGRWDEIGGDADTKIVRDPWGGEARYWRHKSGTPEHLGFGCRTREDWERTYRPAFLAAPIQTDLDEAARSLQAGRARDRWCFFAGVEGFEVLRMLLGDEVFLQAMVDDPEWIRDISRVAADSFLRELQAAWDRGLHVDGVWVYGDMAYNHATLCSPRMYRDTVWPDHCRIAAWAHDHGLKCIFHTDGNVNAVIGDYLDAGFDALQPLEAKAGMDLRRLGPAWGERMVFMGNCDVMAYVTNDLARIEAEIAAKLAAGKATGGYIYHSDHSVPPQVSLETFRAIVEMIDRHGRYDGGGG